MTDQKRRKCVSVCCQFHDKIRRAKQMLCVTSGSGLVSIWCCPYTPLPTPENKNPGTKPKRMQHTHPFLHDHFHYMAPTPRLIPPNPQSALRGKYIHTACEHTQSVKSLGSSSLLLILPFCLRQQSHGEEKRALDLWSLTALVFAMS